MGHMYPVDRATARSERLTVRHAQPGALLDRRPGRRRSCDGRCSTASSSPVRRCARSRWPSRSASPGPTLREALGVLVAEGLATREPNRGVQRRQPRPRRRSTTCPGPARCSRWPACGAGPTAGEERPRGLPPRRCADYAEAAGGRRQPAPSSTAAHLAIHRSFVGLTGSTRLVAMAESLNAEIRLALAKVDRIRRNAARPGALARRPGRPARGRATSRRPPPSSTDHLERCRDVDARPRSTST